MISRVVPFTPIQSILLAVPFLAVLWYLVGLWIDRSLGFVHRNPPKRSTVRDVTVVISAGAAALFLLPVIQTLSRELHVREVRHPVWLTGICAWYVFLMIVLAGMVRFRFFKRRDSAVSSSNV